MGNNKISVLVVNRDNLDFTTQCIKDLAEQSIGFELILVDNGSTEAGTLDALSQLKALHPFISDLWVSGYNRSLSEIWNEFSEKGESDLLCFLNNDVRIPTNFLSDTVEVMERESGVGCVVHATNHPLYKVDNELKYNIVESGYFHQGWDFTMRRQAYSVIPEQLRFYCGDDYVFEGMYKGGWSLAYCLSSPMIHFESRTKRKSSMVKQDMKAYEKLGHEYNLQVNTEYSRFYDDDLKYSGNRRPEILDFVPESYSRVLEIGCADGEFSYRCLNGSAEIWAVEPNEMYIEILKSRGFHKVFSQDFFDCIEELPDGYFDLVVCNDVIEHMVDHERFLMTVKGKIAQGGTLIGSVPNVRYYKVLRDYLFKGEWEYQESGVMDRTHLRWFTFSSLRASFERNGYCVDLIKGINAPKRVKMFIVVMNLFLLGSQRDIKYKQIGFRIKNG